MLHYMKFQESENVQCCVNIFGHHNDYLTGLSFDDCKIVNVKTSYIRNDFKRKYVINSNVKRFTRI